MNKTKKLELKQSTLQLLNRNTQFQSSQNKEGWGGWSSKVLN